MTLRDPFRELVSLRDTVDRMLGESFVQPFDWMTFDLDGKNILPLEIYEEGNNLVVKAPVPGIKPEELNIQVRSDVLTISGETKKEEERKERSYFMREQRYGKFERTVQLPYTVLVDNAEAFFENGVVTLTLPKAEPVPVKQIPIVAK
jgi:HSP20 family protein